MRLTSCTYCKNKIVNVVRRLNSTRNMLLQNIQRYADFYYSANHKGDEVVLMTQANSIFLEPNLILLSFPEQSDTCLFVLPKERYFCYKYVYKIYFLHIVMTVALFYTDNRNDCGTFLHEKS
jgi:hypothetical protein